MKKILLIIIVVACFVLVVVGFGKMAEKALEKQTRFDCWKLQNYASTYEGFWITDKEKEACDEVKEPVNAPVMDEKELQEVWPDDQKL